MISCLDHIFCIYIFEIIIGIASFILYVYWWIHEGSCSWVYKYLTFLFLGSSIDNGIMVVGRYHSLVLKDSSFLYSPWWSLKEGLYTLCIVLIFGHSLYRFLFGPRKEKNMSGDALTHALDSGKEIKPIVCFNDYYSVRWKNEVSDNCGIKNLNEKCRLTDKICSYSNCYRRSAFHVNY